MQCPACLVPLPGWTCAPLCMQQHQCIFSDGPGAKLGMGFWLREGREVDVGQLEAGQAGEGSVGGQQCKSFNSTWLRSEFR